MRNIDAVTPGELLKEDFLEPMGISQYRLAKEIGVAAQRIGQIIAGKRSITADALEDQLKNIRPWTAVSEIGHRA
ncbi:HigA family addiction module antitoxin [Marinobacter salexigens]|uniref:HigA family addiction module antidote protein n=1 Tax=Marinobacter salexigens TaxID=1925763 RepID=A0ABS6A4B4_9GAMM|nr:HigA family addiction module antitoxin [Marinobacter salexigens]MBU2872997.1 HigA family addiction module antidote protein [Marinobacter salexigens]